MNVCNPFRLCFSCLLLFAVVVAVVTGVVLVVCCHRLNDDTVHCFTNSRKRRTWLKKKNQKRATPIEWKRERERGRPRKRWSQQCFDDTHLNRNLLGSLSYTTRSLCSMIVFILSLSFSHSTCVITTSYASASIIISISTSKRLMITHSAS